MNDNTAINIDREGRRLLPLVTKSMAVVATLPPLALVRNIAVADIVTAAPTPGEAITRRVRFRCSARATDLPLLHVRVCPVRLGLKHRCHARTAPSASNFHTSTPFVRGTGLVGVVSRSTSNAESPRPRHVPMEGVPAMLLNALSDPCEKTLVAASGVTHLKMIGIRCLTTNRSRAKDAIVKERFEDLARR